MKCSYITNVVVVVVVAFIGKQVLMKGTHSGEALLTDWSAPPPWPIFIAATSLAATLRSMADALVPPPVRIIDMTFAYQTSILIHTCHQYGLADYFANRPKTVTEIAAHTQTADVLRVERIMYAMAADGIAQLLDPTTQDTGSTTMMEP